MRRLTSIVPLTALYSIALIAASIADAQIIKSRRDAYGADRATRVETLLQALYPGAIVQWDPVLAIRDSSGALTAIDLGDLETTRRSDGSVTGVTVVEAGTAKADYIRNVTKFQPVEHQAFITKIIVFHDDSSGHVVNFKKIPVDSGDPLTKISWFDVQKWSDSGWPVLRLNYASYIPMGDALTMIQWDSLFDTATGSFLARAPAGILVTHKNGEQTGEMFSVHRTSPTQIQIIGAMTKKVIEYPCGDPCIVDGPTLLKQWSQ